MSTLGQGHGDAQTVVAKELSESSLPLPSNGSGDEFSRHGSHPLETDGKKATRTGHLVLKVLWWWWCVWYESLRSRRVYPGACLGAMN